MNQDPRKPIRRPVPSAAKPATRTAAAPKPPVGRSLLQPSTAFAISLATQGSSRTAPAQAKPAEATIPVTTSGSLRVPEATLDIMQSLMDILTRELVLLKKQDIKGISELQQQKNRLISNYQANIKAIASRPELVKEAPTELREKLRATGKKLDEITKQNATALKGAALATKRVLQNIIGMIREETMPRQMTYGNLRLAKAAGAYGNSCPSVAVNRTA